jgi:polysaccharide export outer membrane protein
MFRTLCVTLVTALSIAAVPASGQVTPLGSPIGAPIQAGVDTQAPRADAAITPLDKLSVTVFREPELSAEEVAVDEGGRIALPLIGAVTAAGKSTDVLSTEISGKLRQYIRNPQVAVSLKQAASRRVTITGSVMQPGVYPLEGRMTLLQAVALARGPSQVASLDQTLIFRTRDGVRQAARFNLDAIAKGKSEDPEVISGDTVALGSSKFKTAWRDVIGSIRSFNIFSVIQ